ncbi:hypothetical protein HWV62_24314 [Athelia sp. TMB]|nr:hypothetical protein HWV62_24314 [Athelia sp. TMB]
MSDNPYKNAFIQMMGSQGVIIPPSVIAKPMAEFLTAVADMVIPLEGQQLMVTSMLMLNGPLRTELPENLIRPLNDKLVAVIYEMMPHPPRNLAAQDFRSVDGADRLGAAYVPYAKSVISTKEYPKPPPAEEVFNKLMMREQYYDKSNPPKRIGEKPLHNPDGLSSLTFAYGTLVIHSVFNSSLTDPSINETSSYFDLSPLYGDDVAEQESVRNRTGRGMLAPDCFVDHRMLFLPPAAAALLVVFNRNHNWIAQELLAKEGKDRKWVDPSELIDDTTRRNKQDDEIFEIARLVNCVHFVNIVITDYVGGVMGRTIRGGGWPLNAETFDRIDLPDRALTYAQDRTKLTVEDYLRAYRQMEQPNKDPKLRTFAGLVRDPVTKRFNDNDLAKLIHDATEAKAGMFRAHGTPLRYTSFKEWNGNEEVAKTASELYGGDIDRLELYPGLHAEGIVGDGLGVEYSPVRVNTMRNGLLLDAVALVNSSHHGLLTENYTPTGFADVQRDTSNKAYGGCITNQHHKVHKLLFRTLPYGFPENSVYSWFPMTTPNAMQDALKNSPAFSYTRPTGIAPTSQ